MLKIEPWKKLLVLIIGIFSILYSIPNFFHFDSDYFFSKNKLRLGLDLQGGSYLLLKVESNVVVEERLESILEEARISFRGARIGYNSIGVFDDALNIKLKPDQNKPSIIEIINNIDTSLDVNISDDWLLTANYNKESTNALKNSALQQSLEIIRRRIDETGTNEPIIQRQGIERIMVQLPGIDDPERVKRLLGKTAKMNFRMVDEKASIQNAVNGRTPAGSELIYGNEEENKIPYVIRKRVGVSGDSLVDAQPSMDQNNQPVVSLRFDVSGSRKFANLTANNIGKRFAIVLDGEVISAPVIREAIPGGVGQISGNFTFETANDLALLLRAGSLPAPLTILEERTVGPSLGKDSIDSGAKAGIIALFLVAIYMFAVYGPFGLIANIALSINVCLIISLLSLVGATLTLPGIAGIALTVGMAVDANVLVFERIREESLNGRSIINAIDAGYKQALHAIFDANITTLIAAIILFFLGSGPIKGFSITLAIGVITTVFTSLMVSRVLIVLWLSKTKAKSLPI